MKRFILTLAGAVSLIFATAQNPVQKAFPKTIQVTGTAEMEIIPDEIHVLVTLKEYEKKGKGKTDIESIRNGFLSAVKKAGIADSAIVLASVSGNNGMPWWKKKQKDELFASVTYEIIFNEPGKIDRLVNLLDDEATENFEIAEITHSRIKTLQKQLRADALKAAKEKAAFLSAAIDEAIGSAITITENALPQNYSRIANTLSFNKMEDAESAGINSPEFKKLVIRSEMSVVFELK